MDINVGSDRNIEPPPLLFGPRVPSPHPSHPGMSTQLPPHQPQSPNPPRSTSRSPLSAAASEQASDGSFEESVVHADGSATMDRAQESADTDTAIGRASFREDAGHPERMDVTVEEVQPSVAHANPDRERVNRESSAEQLGTPPGTTTVTQQASQDRITLLEANLRPEAGPPATLNGSASGLTQPVGSEAPNSPHNIPETSHQAPPEVLMAEDPPGHISVDTSSDSESDGENAPARPIFIDPEDTSVPDEEELRDIESRTERLGDDHERFERKYFKELGDPEYVPGESGRIEWTLTNVRGTTEHPNREVCLRSPKVRIGSMDWNIKFYPKGNGTDYLSVYLECTDPPASSSAQPLSSPRSRSHTPGTLPIGAASSADPSPNPIDTNQHTLETPSNSHGTARVVGGGAGETVLLATQDADDDLSFDADTSSSDSDDEDDRGHSDWEVPAQIGLVIYNPAEPRVYVGHGNHHRFSKKSPDWGWTRFHGPHCRIHRRARGQRQALLRNDTLTFTAYLRIVKDETGSLWEHSRPTRGRSSFDNTGFRSVEVESSGASRLATALLSWCLLPPFQRIINSIPTYDPEKVMFKRPKNLVIGLQTFLHVFRFSRRTSDPVQLRSVSESLSRAGIRVDHLGDVTKIWQVLRHQLAKELSGTGFKQELSELFDEVIERQTIPNDSHGTTIPTQMKPLSEQALGFRIPVKGCGTVRNALTQALGAGVSKASLRKVPKVLHLELDRQEFDLSLRKWKKIVDRIEIDEHLDLGKWVAKDFESSRFTLYEFVVHSGELQRGSYATIFRPGGPGTKWISFVCDSDLMRPLCLTKKQAFSSYGRGTTATTSEEAQRVPYILMYVRDDVLDQELQGGQTDTKAPAWIRHGPLKHLVKARDSFREPVLKPKDQINLRIFNVDLFEGHAGRGIFDIYDLPTEPASSGKVLDLVFPAEAPISAVQSWLVSNVDGISDTRQCLLWFLWHAVDPLLRGLRLARPADTVLHDYTASSETVFLLTILPPGEVEPAAAPAAHQPDQLENASLSPPHTGITSSEAINDTLAPLASSDEYQQSTASVIGEHNAAANEATGGDSPMTNSTLDDLSAVQDQDDVQMGEAYEEADGSDSEEVARLAAQVIEMQGRLDEMISAPDLPQAHTHEAIFPPPTTIGSPLATSSGQRQTTGSLPRSSETTLFFLKRFDVRKQALYGVGSFVVRRDQSIDPLVRKGLNLSKDHQIQLWRETRFGDAQKLNPSSTLGPECLGTHIVIASDVLQPEELSQVRCDGGLQDVPAYLEYIIRRDSDPEPMDGLVTQNYFGSAYFAGFQKNGRPHGQGTLIYTSGDKDEGRFAAGQRHGKGRITFQNGDVYDGDWANDTMDGQGSLIYAKTGNAYTGGFKAGRRHGRGMMNFLVSEEEQTFCQICYEGVMDCLFYDCGHVCACLDCAKQVEICPLCRKPVISVVKMYRS